MDAPDDRLQSWKEIAAYLGATDRTVQRWEAEEGLPVHRLVHKQRANVYAYKHELEAWLEARSAKAVPIDPPAAQDGSSDASPTSLRLGRYAAGFLAAAVIASIAYWAGSRGASRSWTPTTVLDVTLPASAVPQMIAISPDGRKIAYVAPESVPGPNKLWIRSLDEQATRALPGTDDAWNPFWSPDSESLGFFAHFKLKTIRVNGEPPRELAAIEARGSGGAWNQFDQIVYSSGEFGGLMAVPASGGDPTPATQLDEAADDNSHRGPIFLPGGKRILYAVRRGFPDKITYGIHLAEPGSSESIRLVETESRPQFVPSTEGAGTLLHVRGGVLLAQQVDLDMPAAVGDPEPVVRDVSYRPASAWAGFTVSNNGTLVYHRAQPEGVDRRLIWRDRRGRQIDEIVTRYANRNVELSPDGRRALVIALGRAEIRLIDLDVETDTLVQAPGGTVIWTPDGKGAAVMGVVGSGRQIFLSDLERIIEGPLNLGNSYSHLPRSYAPDGSLLYSERHPDSGEDLWVLPAGPDAKPIPIATTDATEFFGEFSPDGKWIAYASDRSGLPEIYVQSYPPSGAARIVSTGGGVEPIWNPSGAELFYLNPETRMLWAVPFEATGTGFRAGQPSQLFVIEESPAPPSYAVAPDGERFLIAPPPNEAQSTPLTVVLNWRPPQ